MYRSVFAQCGLFVKRQMIYVCKFLCARNKWQWNDVGPNVLLRKMNACTPLPSVFRVECHKNEDGKKGMASL